MGGQLIESGSIGARGRRGDDAGGGRVWCQRVDQTLRAHAGVTGPYLFGPTMVIPTSRDWNSNIPRLIQAGATGTSSPRNLMDPTDLKYPVHPCDSPEPETATTRGTRS